MYKNWLKDYFSFTRKERNAVLVLILVIIVITVLPYMLPSKESSVDKAALEQFRQQVAQLKPVLKDSFAPDKESRPSGYNYYPDKAHAIAGELFYFDPNTLNEEGWKKLGLPERTARTIRHYLEKGGRFRSPEDLGKIYSLKRNEVERLLPYIRLNQPGKEGSRTVQQEAVDRHAYTGSFKPLYVDLLIDINHTDTTTLQLLPGIGSKLAARIINFRDKLGGFYAVDQVAETYGLPDSTFQKIKSHLKVSEPELTLVDINTSDAEQLKQHPYIRWNIANAIIQYRRQHGSFSSKEDLLQIAAISPEQYKKLMPYIKIE